MQFLLSVIDSHTGSATPDEMTAIGAFNEQLRQGGHWVFAGGLSAPEQASVIDGRGSEPAVTRGPLHSGHESLSGCWIIEADTTEQAQELAAAASRACNRRVELRAFL